MTAALRALGGKVEPTADGMVIEGTGGLRGGTIDSHGDHRIAMLGAVAGLASTRGRRGRGMDAAAVSYPGFEADLASLLAAEHRFHPCLQADWKRRSIRCRHGDRDRRACRGRQVHGRARGRGRARLHLPRLRGDVPLRGAGGAARPASTSTTARRSGALAEGLEIGFDGRRVLLGERDVSERDPHPRGDRRRLPGLRPPAGARGDGRPPARS